MLLIAGAVAVTSAHLSRMRLLDVADGAALSAANALDDSAYDAGRGGVGAAEQPVGAGAGGGLPRQPPAARQHPRVAARARARAPPTVAPPSSSSSARRELPMVGPALRDLGVSVTIRVESRARSDVAP